MSKQVLPRNPYNEPRNALPIILGGTGGVTAEEAIANLGAISKTLTGNANGCASLGSNHKIPNSQLGFVPEDEMPSLNGPAICYTHLTAHYAITNFDSLTPYIISAKYGEVTLVNDSITYYYEGLPCTDVITVNGIPHNISVVASRINKPEILSPLNNASTVFLYPLLAMSDITFTGAEDTIIETEWELSANSDFSVLIELNSELNVLQPLHEGDTYYARVRVSGELLGWSEWSDVSTFVIANNRLPNHEVAILQPDLTLVSGYLFGTGLTLSKDGTVLVVGQSNGTVSTVTGINNGAVNIYKKINNVWVLQTVFIDIELEALSDIEFGHQVAITEDKQTIIVSALYASDTESLVENAGKVYIYKTTIPDDYTSLVLVTTIYTNSPNIGDRFGINLTITPNAEKIVVGYWNKITFNTGYYIFSYDGETCIEEATIPAYLWNMSVQNISDDGLTFTCAQVNDESGVINSGRLEVYKFNGSVWNLDTSFVDDILMPNTWLGYPATISGDGKMLVTTTEQSIDAALFIYELIDDVWTRTYKIPFFPDLDLNTYGCEIDQVLINKTKDLIVFSTPLASNMLAYPESSEWDNWGGVYAYRKVGSAWVLDTILIQSDQAPTLVYIEEWDYYQGNGNGFGAMLSMDETGQTLAVSAVYRPVNGEELVGSVFIYN